MKPLPAEQPGAHLLVEEDVERGGLSAARNACLWRITLRPASSSMGTILPGKSSRTPPDPCHCRSEVEQESAAARDHALEHAAPARPGRRRYRRRWYSSPPCQSSTTCHPCREDGLLGHQVHDQCLLDGAQDVVREAALGNAGDLLLSRKVGNAQGLAPLVEMGGPVRAIVGRGLPVRSSFRGSQLRRAAFARMSIMWQ